MSDSQLMDNSVSDRLLEHAGYECFGIDVVPRVVARPAQRTGVKEIGVVWLVCAAVDEHPKVLSAYRR